MSNNDLSVNGQNFNNGEMPSLTLSGVGSLDVIAFNASNTMASITEGSLPDADYLLTVSTFST